MDQYLDMLVASGEYDILQLENLVKQNAEVFAQIKFVEFMLNYLRNNVNGLIFMYYGDDDEI